MAFSSKPKSEAPSVGQTAITAGTWPEPIDGFRADVAGDALTGLIPVGDEKTPYPTGTPLSATRRFWLVNGFYKGVAPV
jgi:hypothetical protein